MNEILTFIRKRYSTNWKAIYPLSAKVLIAAIVVFLVFESAFAAVNVNNIAIEGLYSVSKEELLYLLEIESGRPLDPAALRRGIKRAYMKGTFKRIDVESDDEGNVKIKIIETFVLRDLIVKGNKEISVKFIKHQLGWREGMSIEKEFLDNSASFLKGVIREKGFPDARVSAEIKPTRKPYDVDVVIDIKEGKPLLISSFNIIGSPDGGKDMRLKKGDVFDQMVLREDMENLGRKLRKKGYLKPVIGPYSYLDGELFLNVSPGKKLSVTISGNSSVRTKKLLSVMPFFEESDVREDLVEEAVLNMALLYHSEGHPDVQIAPIITEKDDDIIINFYVFEGKKIKVGTVIISGASIDQKSIKGIMSLRESGTFDSDLLDEDMRRIKDFYIALGYLDVSVNEPSVAIADSLANISVEIDEGDKLTISEIEVEGAKTFSREEILKEIKLKAGVPYNEVDVMDARHRVLGLYRVRGYARSSVEVKRKFAGGGAVLIFAIEEGPVFSFGKTVVLGNSDTRIRVIDRELAYREGAPYDNTLLMRTRQRLYRLNLFSDVEMRAQPSYDETIDVAIKVKETEAGTVEFGLGYGEYEQYRGFLELGYRNLFGMNRQASFRTEMSSLHERYILTYNEPWFIGRHLPVRFLLMREERTEKNIDTGEVWYRLKRHTASTDVQKMLGERARVDLFYEFSLTETYDVMPDVILSREDTGTLSISSIIPSIVYDSRDNPFDPSRGIFTGISLKAASGLLFSETDFLKFTLHGSVYRHPLKFITIAVSLKSGVAEGLRDTKELPLVERFFLGGRNTMRGFDQDMVGPVGILGTPIGGNAFLLGNFELRFHITKNWRLVGFIDGGNVWRDIKDIDPTDLRYGAGPGLRYNTPVGPIRVDYGWKFNKRPEETASEVHFSIGHAF